MNDSFLEDLELAQAEPRLENIPRDADRNITRRRSQPSPRQQETLDCVGEKTPRIREKVASLGASSTPQSRVSRPKSTDGVETQNSELAALRSRRTEKSCMGETKYLTPESTARSDAGKKRLDCKERPPWSAGGIRETSRSSDVSSKENSRPSDASRESVASSKAVDSTARQKRDRRGSAGDAQRSKRDETFEVAMLNSVKEIVGTYTRNESTKILRAMQEIYINSQANMIKMMMRGNDDFANDAKDTGRLRTLVEENACLREELSRVTEESEGLRKENVQLKLRCKELVKSGAASKENARPLSNPSKESSASKMRSGKLSEICKNSK